MLFNSMDFLLFFPLVILIYFIIPRRIQWIWLLLASYYFYMSWNPRYVILIMASTLVTWLTGLYIGIGTRKEAKFWLVCCILLNFGILFFFKYYDFAAGNVDKLCAALGLSFRVPRFDLILPVGISFYTFQAIGYVIDVYRGKIPAEKNLFRYALFISFFPQLVAGPIERSKNLMHQVWETHAFDAKRAQDGLLLMGWGFFEKMVLADRIALLVNDVYQNYRDCTGLQICIATILFAFQIYCDFAGYSDIAIGAARIMGFDLMKNFNSPYLATNVQEFWRRWHISLTTWFRDYVYISLGGNRKGKWKWYRNLLVTFTASGLWHGADWNFLVWGG